jgi:hypothetical protein
MRTDVSDKCMEHMCLDPRLFFAGAPSRYLDYPLTKISIPEKASTIKSIVKEARCYLHDGSMIELMNTWTMDSNDATEE